MIYINFYRELIFVQLAIEYVKNRKHFIEFITLSTQAGALFTVCFALVYFE